MVPMWVLVQPRWKPRATAKEGVHPTSHCGGKMVNHQEIFIVGSTKLLAASFFC